MAARRMLSKQIGLGPKRMDRRASCGAARGTSGSMHDGEALYLRNAGDAASLLAPLLAGAVRECLLVAHVGRDHRLLQLVREEEGARDQVSIPARAILVDAIRLGSSRLILAHCHPSGDPAPSAHDIAATRRLADMAAVVGISLEDHLIFAGGDCRSFRALGLL